jgi:hypothetical protein
VREKTAAEKKTTSTISYPPYVNAYGAIPKLFTAIRAASVPPKFTQDYLESVLGMKSTSHRALIPLLKRLGFLDQTNVPTEKYRQMRDEDIGPSVLAEQIRSAYADLYRANEYAHRLPKAELATKLRTVLGAAKDDAVIKSVVGTYQELAKLANFDSAPSDRQEEEDEERDDDKDNASRQRARKAHELGISYTINLNLPATTDIQVFNSIFKALKEHILGED